MSEMQNGDVIYYELKEFQFFEFFFRWVRKKSFWIVVFCIGCGGIEMLLLVIVRYDFECFGIMFNLVFRMVDFFFIMGYVMLKIFKRIIIIYEMMQDLKYVFVYGFCLINGGVYWDF